MTRQVAKPAATRRARYIRKTWMKLKRLGKSTRGWWRLYRGEVRERAQKIRREARFRKRIPGYRWLIKHQRKIIWRLSMLTAVKRMAVEGAVTLVMYGKPGKLSWYVLVNLSLKNLKSRWSRTMVTGGAIAVGIGTTVFLISFGYGLQDIVTQRLVHPNSLRLIDVQSDSTALNMDQKAVTDMAQMPHVENVARMVSLAGSLVIGTQKMETVVVGAENDFLDYSGAQITAGTLFSAEGNAPYVSTGSEVSSLMQLTDRMGEVAGATDEAEEPQIGKTVSDQSVWFRVPDETYVPLVEQPTTASRKLGFIRGSVVQEFQGVEVWGASYQSSGLEGRAYRGQSGRWYGTWIKADLPVWEELAPTLYTRLVDEKGEQVVKTAYVPLGVVNQLGLLERETAQLASKVLGESTEAATEAAQASVQTGVATEAAALELMLVREGEQAATKSASGGIVTVARKGGKEMIVSTGLLSLMKMPANEAVGKQASLAMIVSGGLIPEMSGRVMSEKVGYTIVGVVKDDARSVAYVPLGEVTSMGVERFSLFKVLVTDATVVKAVRERIEALGYLTQSLADTLVQVDRLFRLMRILLGAVGVIALAVALLGMFNTLTISLMERTREIGVMKTLGTTNTDVVRLYLVESTMLGLMGGVVGALAGTLLGKGIDVAVWIIRGSISVSMFKTPPGLFIVALGVSMVVGMLTGLLPARRATQISALNALRYE